MKVFLDLDGVLCSWNTAAVSMLGLDPNDPEVRAFLKQEGGFGAYLKEPERRNELETLIGDAGYDFWYNLEMLPWAHTLYEKLMSLTDGAVVFCTSPGNWSVAASAKIDFISKHFNTNNFLILRDKEWIAAYDHFLVDDSYYQLKPFKDAGGEGFLWPNEFHLLDNPLEVTSSLVNLETHFKGWAEKNDLKHFKKSVGFIAPYTGSPQITGFKK